MRFNSRRKSEKRRGLKGEWRIPAEGGIARGRKVFRACLAKSSMPVIEPDLEPLVRECFLDDQIRHSVRVDIKDRKRRSRVVGDER